MRLPPMSGKDPLKAPSIRLSSPNWIMIKPQKVKKWAMPGRGSRKTPL